MRLAACHAGVGLTTSDEAPGREGQGRGGRGAGHALGLGQLSEVVPPGRQMEDHASRSCVPTAQSAAPEESTSWALNHPRIIWLLSRQVPPVKSKRALGFLIEAGHGWWMAEAPAAHTLAHLQCQLKYSGLLHFRAPALPPSLLHLSHQPDPSVDLPLPIYLCLHLSLSHLAPGAPAKSSAEPETSSTSPLT